MYDVTDIQGNSNLVRANVKFELSGFELLGAYGGDYLFEFERLLDAIHVIDYVIQLNHQLNLLY